MKKISLVIPSYNEEESIPYLYKRIVNLINQLNNYEFEILFINDGSKDKTFEMIKELRQYDNRVSYVNLSRNFGKEIAMLAGLDYAKGDCLIFMDADLQDPPELIPELIKYWEEGYDDIYAKRSNRKNETWLKKVTSKLYYIILQKVTSIEIQKDTGDFRLLDRRCINALKKMRETQRCSKSMFSWIGYKKKEVTYDRDPRIAGTTKWKYRKLIDLAIDRNNFFHNLSTQNSNIYKYTNFYDTIYIFNICYNKKYNAKCSDSSFSSYYFNNTFLFCNYNFINWDYRRIFRKNF